MAPFMEQGVNAVKATANLIRLCVTGEVYLAGNPGAVIKIRRYGTVTKTVLVFTFAV